MPPSARPAASWPSNRWPRTSSHGDTQRPARRLPARPRRRRGRRSSTSSARSRTDAGQRLVGRRPGDRRRQHQRLDQRQRPLRRLPVGRNQPRGRRRQRRRRRLRPRSAARADASRQHRDRRHVGVGGTSLRPVISQNGRFVAFDSAAVLTAGDSNGIRDVFVHDRDLDADGVMDEPGAVATRRVSVAVVRGRRPSGGDSVDPSITATVATSSTPRRRPTWSPPTPTRSATCSCTTATSTPTACSTSPGQIATRRAQRRRRRQPSSPSRAACRASAPTASCSVFLVASAQHGRAHGRRSAHGRRHGVGSRQVGALGQSDPDQARSRRRPTSGRPGRRPPRATTRTPRTRRRRLTATSWGGTDVTDVPTVVDPRGAAGGRRVAGDCGRVPRAKARPAAATVVVIEGNDLAGTLYWNGGAACAAHDEPDAMDRAWRRRAAVPRDRPALPVMDGDRRSNVASFTYLARSVPRWTRHAPLAAAWPAVASNVPLTITGSGFTADDRPSASARELAAVSRVERRPADRHGASRPTSPGPCRSSSPTAMAPKPFPTRRSRTRTPPSR